MNLKEFINPPKQKKNQDTYKYMCTDFINAVRKCLRSGGYSLVKDNVEEGGEFLVGYDKRLFCIESDFQVAEYHMNYASVGCGEDIALGSMYSTENTGDPKGRIKCALRAAQEFSAYVREPFIIEVLK